MAGTLTLFKYRQGLKQSFFIFLAKTTSKNVVQWVKAMETNQKFCTSNPTRPSVVLMDPISLGGSQ